MLASRSAVQVCHMTSLTKAVLPKSNPIAYQGARPMKSPFAKTALFKIALALAVSVCLVAAACGSDGNSYEGTDIVLTGTDLDKAKEQVAAAIYRYNQIGDDAFDEISDTDGSFIDGETYTFVITTGGVVRAHAANPDLVGDDISDLQDSDGSLVTQGIIDVASPQGGLATYRFNNPVTGEEEPKDSWVVLHDNLIFGSGDYITEAEWAQQMVDQALALYDEMGEDAFDVINNSGDFIQGEIYVFVTGVDRISKAHAYNPSLQGTSRADLVDSRGTRITNLLIIYATNAGAWVTYYRNNPSICEDDSPTEDCEQAKRSWVVLRDNYVFGAGYFE